MLAAAWHTNRLLLTDATPGDAGAAHGALVDCEDVGSLDPAFRTVPQAEIEAHIARSIRSAESGERTFQMQMMRLRESDAVVGYWHFQVVPSQPTAVGISILLIRPAFRRLGLGRELISSAAANLAPGKQELWARVYLANPRAIAFWAGVGFVRLTAHQGAYVSSADSQPSIILARRLPHRT